MFDVNSNTIILQDPRLVKDAPITIENDAMKTLLGPIEFFSATYR